MLDLDLRVELALAMATLRPPFLLRMKNLQLDLDLRVELALAMATMRPPLLLRMKNLQLDLDLHIQPLPGLQAPEEH